LGTAPRAAEQSPELDPSHHSEREQSRPVGIRHLPGDQGGDGPEPDWHISARDPWLSRTGLWGPGDRHPVASVGHELRAPGRAEMGSWVMGMVLRSPRGAGMALEACDCP